MQKFMTTAFFFALANFAAADDQPAPVEKPLTPAKKVLRAIDNICGDTWCEGEFQFKFHRVSMNKSSNTTRVYFTMSIGKDNVLDVTPIAAQGFTAQVGLQKFAVDCTIPGYGTPEVLLRDEDSLNWDFYLSLSSCIEALEERLTRVSRTPA
jgi:hypothetical protein